MARKPTGNPNGRPPKTAEVEAAERIAEKTGAPLDEAAPKAKTSRRTVTRHRAKRRASAPATKRPQASPHPPGPPTSSSPTTGSQGPANGTGGAVSGRPDLLELVRRILDARYPAARVELDEGLRLHVAGGEEALAPWLGRPIVAAEVGVDELDALGRGLDLAVELLARAGPEGGAALRALREVASLGKSLATVKGRRPPEPKPDEVTAKIVAVHDAAIDRMGILTRDEAVAFAREREAFEAWAVASLGPVLGPEVVRRLGLVLDGPPPAEAAA